MVHGGPMPAVIGLYRDLDKDKQLRVPPWRLRSVELLDELSPKMNCDNSGNLLTQEENKYLQNFWLYTY